MFSDEKSSTAISLDPRRTTHFGWLEPTGDLHERQITIPTCASTGTASATQAPRWAAQWRTASHRRGCAHQHRMLRSNAGRRVLATLHGAPWHKHFELVVTGRQRSIAHQPRHQGVFEGARNPPPHVASVLARLEPTRFSLLARVGNGIGSASSSPGSNCAP